MIASGGTVFLGSRLGIHSPVIIDISKRTALRTESLTAQGAFGRIIAVVRRNLCFLSVYMGNPSC